MSKRRMTSQEQRFWRAFGQRCRRLREEELQLSRRALAKRLRRSLGYVTHVEVGRRGIPLTELGTWARVLRVPPMFLLPHAWRRGCDDHNPF